MVRDQDLGKPIERLFDLAERVLMAAAVGGRLSLDKLLPGIAELFEQQLSEGVAVLIRRLRLCPNIAVCFFPRSSATLALAVSRLQFEIRISKSRIPPPMFSAWHFQAPFSMLSENDAVLSS